LDADPGLIWISLKPGIRIQNGKINTSKDKTKKYLGMLAFFFGDWRLLLVFEKSSWKTFRKINIIF
jgi:hypothetical protein